KLTLAALEATLEGPQVPVRLALEAPTDGLRRRAERIVARLDDAGVAVAEAVDSTAAVGGGGAPGVTIPSVAVSVPAESARALRLGDPPVIGRVEHGRCLLDLRTVAPAADDVVLEAIRAAVAHGSR
ncbi:MAG: L-seryl-tRNA(Sec) selenium transferase, partial [Actinophytocola sp.]|nr:L-seryl-tRNA(Sec) selenium transferase [Actinophytocola sp.]